MNKKRVLISVLDEHGEGLARLLCQEVARVGYEPAAHCWTDDLANMAWVPVRDELAREDCRLWIIAGATARFADKATCQGLALAAMGAQAVHGHGFPILLSPSAGTVEVDELPTPLRGAESVKSGLGAKVAVRGAAARKGVDGEYRLMPHGLPGVGLWLEVGPVREPWNGAFLGLSGVDAKGTALAPSAHGVGQAGTIPATSTLHYPVQGLQLDMGGETYTAWGLKNPLSPAESYFVRVPSALEGVVFGAFPDADDAEVFTLRLC